MQKILIAGNVSSVKEIRDVGQNKVFNFSVAVSNGKDQSGEWKPSSFYDVAVWNKRGEALARVLSKGTKVTVSGRLLPVRVHEGKAYQSVDADDVLLQGGGADSGHAREPDTAGNGTARYDDSQEDSIPF